MEEEPLYRLSKSSKPNFYVRFPLVGMILVFILLIIAGIFFLPKLISKPKSNSTAKTSPTPTPTIQVKVQDNRPHKLAGVAGTIRKIDKGAKVASAEAVLTVGGDNAKDYTVPVNSVTKINKYSAGTASSSPTVLTDKESWKSLAVGDRVYVYCYVDVSVVTQLQIKDIIALDWYVTPKPNE